MDFVVDECTGPAVARWLERQGHSVFSVYDQAPGIGDDRVLELAIERKSILITNDKGFGERIFSRRQQHLGIVLLRLDNERSANKITVLESLLRRFGRRIAGRFVVATERSVRIAETHREG